MNQKEIWMPVNGYEKYYEVSNFGNVKSKDRTTTYIHRGTPTTRTFKGKTMMPQKSKDGYLYIQMNGAELKTVKIHRLVAEHFIFNPDNKPCVNHLDGNKENNRISNLEWVTHSENTRHAYDTGLKIAIKGKHHYKSKRVMNTKTKEIFGHLREAADKTGLKYSTLAGYLNGLRKNKTDLVYID